MNADARARAREYYRNTGRSLEADLAALAEHPGGVVLMMPQLVVLMKPVLHTQPELWPQLEHIAPEPDAWYIHLLVGNLALARRLAAAQEPRAWLCFQRGLRSTAPHCRPWHAFVNQPPTK